MLISGITHNGLTLQIPLVNQYCAVVTGKQKGAELFGSHDEALIDIAEKLADKSFDLRYAREDGAEKERTCIIQDLRDDAQAKIRALLRFYEPASFTDNLNWIKAIENCNLDFQKNGASYK